MEDESELRAGSGVGRKVLSHCGGVWLANLEKPNLQGGEKASCKSSCISLVPLELQINYVRNPSAKSVFVLSCISF